MEMGSSAFFRPRTKAFELAFVFIEIGFGRAQNFSEEKKPSVKTEIGQQLFVSLN